MASEPAREALRELDKALADKPHTAGHTFSAATQHLCLLRDHLSAASRQGGDGAARQQLAHVNAVISVVLAGHFPLGAVPWDELEKAREWLADIVRGEPA